MTAFDDLEYKFIVRDAEGTVATRENSILRDWSFRDGTQASGLNGIDLQVEAWVRDPLGSISKIVPVSLGTRHSAIKLPENLLSLVELGDADALHQAVARLTHCEPLAARALTMGLRTP